MNNTIKTKKGFTLVELVIVIVIVGILSVISVPIYKGYVEKAKYTEGYVLLNAIAKAELAYHVRYDCFVSDSGEKGGVGKGEYLDIDSSGNKYFTLWGANARNSHSGKFLSSKKAINKGEKASDDGDDDSEEYDYADLYVGYDSPKGQIVLHMEVYSNGGCSEIKRVSGPGSDDGGDDVINDGGDDVINDGGDGGDDVILQ